MIKFCVCDVCQQENCPYFLKHAFNGDSWCCYEPSDSDSDIGSETVKEMRLQNGDF